MCNVADAQRRRKARSVVMLGSLSRCVKPSLVLALESTANGADEEPCSTECAIVSKLTKRLNRVNCSRKKRWQFIGLAVEPHARELDFRAETNAGLVDVCGKLGC
jgi:hypothetical protein